MERRPVGNVEYEEDDREGDEHGHVQLAGLVFLQRGHDLAEGLDLHLEQDDGVLEERAKDEEDAADDPRLHGVQAVGLGGVGCRRVENVHLEGKMEKVDFWERSISFCTQGTIQILELIFTSTMYRTCMWYTQ